MTLWFKTTKWCKLCGLKPQSLQTTKSLIKGSASGSGCRSAPADIARESGPCDAKIQQQHNNTTTQQQANPLFGSFSGSARGGGACRVVEHFFWKKNKETFLCYFFLKKKIKKLFFVIFLFFWGARGPPLFCRLRGSARGGGLVESWRALFFWKKT